MMSFYNLFFNEKCSFEEKVEQIPQVWKELTRYLIEHNGCFHENNK